MMLTDFVRVEKEDTRKHSGRHDREEIRKIPRWHLVSGFLAELKKVRLYKERRGREAATPDRTYSSPPFSPCVPFCTAPWVWLSGPGPHPRPQKWDLARPSLYRGTKPDQEAVEELPCGVAPVAWQGGEGTECPLRFILSRRFLKLRHGGYFTSKVVYGAFVASSTKEKQVLSCFQNTYFPNLSNLITWVLKMENHSCVILFLCSIYIFIK